MYYIKQQVKAHCSLLRQEAVQFWKCFIHYQIFPVGVHFPGKVLADDVQWNQCPTWIISDTCRSWNIFSWIYCSLIYNKSEHQLSSLLLQMRKRCWFPKWYFSAGLKQCVIQCIYLWFLKIIKKIKQDNRFVDNAWLGMSFLVPCPSSPVWVLALLEFLS